VGGDVGFTGEAENKNWQRLAWMDAASIFGGVGLNCGVSDDDKTDPFRIIASLLK